MNYANVNEMNNTYPTLTSVKKCQLTNFLFIPRYTANISNPGCHTAARLPTTPLQGCLPPFVRNLDHDLDIPSLAQLTSDHAGWMIPHGIRDNHRDRATSEQQHGETEN